MKVSRKNFLKFLPMIALIALAVPAAFAFSGCTTCEPDSEAPIPVGDTTAERDCRIVQGGIYMCAYNEDCQVECNCAGGTETPGETTTPTGE